MPPLVLFCLGFFLNQCGLIGKSSNLNEISANIVLVWNELKMLALLTVTVLQLGLFSHFNYICTVTAVKVF